MEANKAIFWLAKGLFSPLFRFLMNHENEKVAIQIPEAATT